MYTRHMGISIPKNYSGVRFTPKDDGIKVKEHRPRYTQAVNNAHSPSFISKSEDIDTPPSVSEPEETDIIMDDIDEYDNNILPDESITTDTDKENNCTACNISDNNTEKEGGRVSLSDHILPIGDILNSVEKDDLLLLGLIFLIAIENDKDNNILLMLLAILLLTK